MSQKFKGHRGWGGRLGGIPGVMGVKGHWGWLGARRGLGLLLGGA